MGCLPSNNVFKGVRKLTVKNVNSRVTSEETS